ncbi:MAG: hypothetical protein JWR69_3530 [Pedosphaera sp.]|nr:hypothetical protein [Pedosphaera sp.]
MVRGSPGRRKVTSNACGCLDYQRWATIFRSSAHAGVREVSGSRLSYGPWSSRPFRPLCPLATSCHGRTPPRGGVKEAHPPANRSKNANPVMASDFVTACVRIGLVSTPDPPITGNCATPQKKGRGNRKVFPPRLRLAQRSLPLANRHSNLSLAHRIHFFNQVLRPRNRNLQQCVQTSSLACRRVHVAHALSLVPQ